MAMGLSEAAAATGVNRSPIYRAWKAGRISATRTSSMRIINGLLALTCSVSMVAPSYAAGVGKGEGQVDIVAWPGYIERGDSDKNYDWVTDFEKKTGCKVNVKTAGTSDEMVALMNEGGFDLVTASGDASLRLIAGNRVQEINPALIPSWKTLDERLQNAPWHTIDGKHYGVPYQWAPNVLMYNTNVFKGAPKSWSVVFEEQTLPDGKSNKWRVQAHDGAIYIADAALYLMAKKPELGIKDPYELNEDQYKAALDVLRKQHALIQRYWHDANAQVDDFKNEGVVASSSWPFQVNLLQSDKRPVASTVPEEGATGWADTTMMAAGAKHPNCAYLWLDHSLQPKVQGDVAAWFGSLPAVPAACKGDALLTDDGCKINGYDNFSRIKFWKTPVAKCASQSTCVPYYRWVTDYIAVIGGKPPPATPPQAAVPRTPFATASAPPAGNAPPPSPTTTASTAPALANVSAVVAGNAAAPPPAQTSASDNAVRGVSDKEIVFGMAAPFSGASRELGRQMKIGVETAFSQINDAGSVNGRLLRLVSADDGYEPTRTAAAMQVLIDKDHVFGFIGNVGTPTAAVALPFALDHRALFFGAFSGANLLRRDPPDRYVFNYRASYAEETNAVVHYLVKVRRIQPKEIVVFAQQDSYGDSGYAGVEKAVRSLPGDNPVIVRLNYKRNTVDVQDAVNGLRAFKGQIKAVVMVASYRAAAKFIEKTRDLYPSLIYTNVSFVGSTALADELTLLGPRYAAGVIVTQVVPAINSYASIVLKYKEALAKYFPGEAPDYVSFEGYIDASILAQAVKRAGRDINTEKLVDELEQMHDLDLGLGAPVSFSSNDHQGSHKVWGTQLGEAGDYQPIELW